MAQQYRQAAEVLGNVLRKKSSVKTSIYQNDKIKNKKIVLAIVSKTLTNIELIKELINEIHDFKEIKQRMMLMVMLNDMITTGKISGGGQIKQIIMKNKEQLPRLKENNQTESSQPTFKWYRLNTLKSQTLPVIENTIEKDIDITDLYKISPPLSMPIDTLLAQDKPSCFPAFILNPPENAVCIDACAAPGNKTTHLATIMKNTGLIYAFDKDKKRVELLKKTVNQYKATNIHVIHNDYLATDPNDELFKDVTHILCDPSCSGSGILERQNTNEKHDAARLRMLSSFQKKVVCHSMQFPNVQKVSYSTCSVNNEENEEVVRAILDENPSFELANILPSWHRRGIMIDDKYPYNYCLRVDPKEDHMTGFFVALFVKKN